MGPPGTPADEAAPTRAPSKAAPKKAAGSGRAATKATAPATTKAPPGEGGTTTWLRVTQVRSVIGTKPKHRGTLGALGLRGIGRTNVLPDRPEIRGMLARVPHLVEVVPVERDEKG